MSEFYAVFCFCRGKKINMIFDSIHIEMKPSAPLDCMWTVNSYRRINDEGMDEDNKARIKHYHEFMCFFPHREWIWSQPNDDGKDMHSTFVYLITLISLEIFFFGFFRYFLIKFDIGSNSIGSANTKSLQHITSHHFVGAQSYWICWNVWGY